MSDYYQLLGISRAATQEQIKESFKKLALRYHPDRNPGGEEFFKQVTEAYNTLSDPARKKAYDWKLFGYREAMSSGTQQEASWRDVTIDPAGRGYASATYKKKYGQSRQRRKTREELDAETMRYFEQRLHSMPQGIRYALYGMLMLWGMQLIFSNWFINEADMAFFLVILGVAIFVVANGFLANSFYFKWAYEVLKFKKPGSPENKAISRFFIFLVLGMGISMGGAEAFGWYQLKYNSGRTLAQVLSGDGHHLAYEFTIGDKLIRKTYDLETGKAEIPRFIVVEYSLQNPKIVRVVGPAQPPSWYKYEY